MSGLNEYYEEEVKRYKQNPVGYKQKPFINKEKKDGRNSKCSCGSGIKYKKCCRDKQGS